MGRMGSPACPAEGGGGIKPHQNHIHFPLYEGVFTERWRGGQEIC